MSILSDNFVNLSDFYEKQILDLIKLSEKFKQGYQVYLKEPVYVANLFFLKTALEPIHHFTWLKVD